MPTGHPTFWLAGDLPTSLQQRLDCDVLFRRRVNAGWDGEGRDSREKSTPVKNEFPHFRRVSGSPPSVEKRPRGWEFLKAASENSTAYAEQEGRAVEFAPNRLPAG
jgi:hypothetical protein